MARQNRGFALADLTLALGLLGILFTVLYAGEVSVRRQVSAAECRAQALFLAQEYIEMTAAELPDIGPSSWHSKVFGRGDGISGVLDIRPAERFPSLRCATLTVTWTDPEGGPGHQLVLSRLVADHLSKAGK